MGKKSNAKKVIRELVKEKQSSQKKKIIGKKSKKELKKEITKKTKKTKPQKQQKSQKAKTSKISKSSTSSASKKLKKSIEIIKKINKRTIFGGVLALIMFMLLVTVGYLLFDKALRSTPTAKYLPADRTIALLEININASHNQYLKTFDLVKDYPEYSEEEFIQYLDDKFNINYEAEVTPWIGRQAAVAYINSEERSDEVLPIFFAEIFSKKNLTTYLEGKNTSKYEGYNIYQLASGQTATTIDNYFIFSTKEEALYELIDFYKNRENLLYNSQKFRKIDNNLPLSRAAFLYIDFDEVNNAFFRQLPFLSEKGVSMEIMSPFTKILDAEGLAVIAMDENFGIETFLSFDTEELQDGQYITFKEKYNAALADYIKDDALAFWGGVNMEYQIKRMVELLTGGDKATITIVDNIFQNYTNKYFGPEIGFEEDLLYLFRKEFAIAIEEIEGEHVYKIIIELEDPKMDSLKIQGIANNFALTGGVFEPKIVETELEDGTIAREIVATPKEITKNQSKYQDTTIYELEMGEGKGIFYAVVNDIAIIANDTSGIKSTIDIIMNKEPSLRNSEFFRLNIRPVLRTSDEVAYFNLEKLLPIFFNEQVIPEYLEAVSSLSSGKNFFNDGIKTINYLHIK